MSNYNTAIVSDYITLTYRDFKATLGPNGGEEIDNLMDGLDTIKFHEKYISLAHLNSLKNESSANRGKIIEEINQELLERDFNADFISEYMSALKKARPDDMLNTLLTERILQYFLYNNNNLKLKDLHLKLTPENLSTKNVDKQTSKALKAQLEFYINQDTMYKEGLKSLLEELETISSEPEITRVSRKVSSVTYIDPTKKEHRKEIYEYYKDRYSLYALMKNDIKEVLTLWDRVEEEMMDEMEDIKDENTGETSKKPTGKKIPSGKYAHSQNDDYIEELDQQLEELKEIHNIMDDNLNYIQKFKLIPYNIITSKDRNVSQNVDSLILQKIGPLLGKKTVEELDQLYEDDFPDYDEGIKLDKNPQEEDTRPQPDMKPDDKNEFDIEHEQLLSELGDMNLTTKVDPLFIIAAESQLLKKKYGVNSWVKTRNEILERIKDAEMNNPGVVSLYKDILEEHEAYEEQAFDEDDDLDEFYIPITDEVVRHLSKYDTNIDITNYNKVEQLHDRLVRCILDILEDPTNKSKTPYHVEQDDFSAEPIPSAKQNASERARIYQNTNIFSRLEIGNKGKKRNNAEFGKFAESLMSLLETADSYYGDPIRDLMLPYKTIPSFLSSDTLSALINHGPENIAQLTLSMYRDYHIGFITPRQISKLTAYLKERYSARKIASDLEKTANGVLDVLEDIVPVNLENDIKWFANEFKEIAQQDSSFNISGITLKGRRISDLDYDRSTNKTVYHTILWMIYKFRSQMLKNPYTSNEMKEFIQEYSQQSDMKTASIAQTKILNTHDVIRKMIGKPIYYNTCKLDNFDNINDTIDIVKSDYKIELTSTDIAGIVVEFDSMQNLAKKYGTKSDVIYHIKALYR
jgi:hypothetical protein